MTFNQYKHLGEMQKAALLWENGIQISMRMKSNYLILLYQIKDFYVEMYLHKEENVVKRVRSFRRTSFFKSKF